jgi:hypothetical protein
MIREWLISQLTIFCTFAVAQGAVMVSQTSEPTPELPGFTTWTLTATSDVPGENIAAMDWAGDPAENDPATGLGFFGPVNQVNPFGLPTVFETFNFLFDAVGAEVKQDSQFLINTSQVSVPAGFAQEGSNILQAVWSWHNSPGLSVPFAQIVMSDVAALMYRGVISINRGDEVARQLVSTHEGPPFALDANFSTFDLIFEHLFTAVDEQPEGLTWSNLTLISDTIPGIAPTLSSEGQFTWQTTGSAFGNTYSWEATVTDIFGMTDVARLSIRLLPEPSTALVFAIGGGPLLLCRRREFGDASHRRYFATLL